ncbi:hypothetical protein BKA65DRAFT_558443 [Rhexocercosporidium sp. MPI-PUGE-AT-0058]|nr:hypothetical protein BKA65DRAFT_558443 [Rhexocercosporidium sp. MPI-PUGE-AT-0058]
MVSQDISKSTNTVSELVMFIPSTPAISGSVANVKTDIESKSVLITCLVLSCVFIALRTGARWFKTRQIPFAAEDVFMYLALASFAIMTALYLDILGTLYNIQLIGAGLLPPYATLLDDLSVMLKEFFAVQFFFWSTLWCVKLSLLFMFQRLTTGLPTYSRVWWAVLTFTILTYVGCVVSQFTSCSSMHAWLSPAGLCDTPRDAVAKAASLWYSLAVDLLTDLMIMAIPVQILYSLRISTAQKLSVGVVFIVSIITMVFAVVRVVSLDSSVANGQVSTTWLILWAAIEGTVAVVVGCLPSFAVFVRGRVEASRVQYYGTSAETPQNPYPASGISRSRAKSRARVESLMLTEMDTARHSSDGASGKSLVEGTIVITQKWN